ncbi:MAG: RagB/SusD family nutrient uptake outer membrane protein [Dysgonamonadaceae bacterium]|jgi:hypothetical protein|nr:RagB/SusD family nutrient uptake outer membrane protein [Dysgonamonadaceae bacterium]
MKKIQLYKVALGFILAFWGLGGLSSCDSFFDNEPDNIQTIEQVFARRNSTLEFLANIYSCIRPIYEWSNQTIWAGICDEIDVTYSDYEISKINLGLLAPDKEGLFYGNLWQHYYPGIRAATYFMQNVDKNIEMDAAEILRCKAEARALRAWFYFCLVRQYGPVVIVPDNLIGADASAGDMQFPRSSIKTCFEYIISEMDEVVKMNALVRERYSGVNYGRVTEVFCKAVKARALLYAASDLYNHDRTLAVFKNFRNIDNSLMMDYADADRRERWEQAAKAQKDIIDNYAFSLYRENDLNGVYSPYNTYQNLFMKDRNSEIIFASPVGKYGVDPGKGGWFWEMELACSPRFLNAWCGWGVVQEMVDDYFTKTGYPLLKGADGKLYAEDGSYIEDGFSAAAGDNGYTQKGTYNMYCNREPRFYISIAFNNSKWLSEYNSSTVEFFYGGNSGRTDKETRNYSQTGYLCRKFVNPHSNVANGERFDHEAVIFRLGEFYLNYVEALNEWDYAANRAEILFYLNAIRSRAGIPGYGTNLSAGELPTPANQEAMREAIRRERRVELAFEEARYFDCCRWAIAHEKFNGAKHGMNANDSRGKDVFHQRTAFENRVFKDYYLLWPLPLSEMYKGKLLVQNPSWSSISSVNMEE